MATNGLEDPNPAFLGTGWSFPPEFSGNGRGVAMISGEDDVHSSLVILFGTVMGERFLMPEYGLSPNEILFEPIGTTMKAFLKDRIATAILIHEPRVRVLSLEIDNPEPGAGSARISLEYEIRATNSRYNLVYPFYRSDSNEAREAAAGGGVPR